MSEMTTQEMLEALSRKNGMWGNILLNEEAEAIAARLKALEGTLSELCYRLGEPEQWDGIQWVTVRKALADARAILDAAREVEK